MDSRFCGNDGAGGAAAKTREVAALAGGNTAGMRGRMLSAASGGADFVGEKLTSAGRRTKATASDIGESASTLFAKLKTRIIKQAGKGGGKNGKS